MRSPILLSLLILLCAVPVWAQKPAAPNPLEIGSDPELRPTPQSEAFSGGHVQAMFGLNASTSGEDAPSVALTYLRESARSFGLAPNEVDQLAVDHVREGRAGTTVRFRQEIGGVPVWGPKTVVNLDNDGRVQAVLVSFRSLPSSIETTPQVTKESARSRVYSHLRLDSPHLEKQDLVIWPAASPRLAWRIRVVGDAPIGDWEAIVDAQTGELLRVADRAITHHGKTSAQHREHNTVPSLTDEAAKASPMLPIASLRRVDGSAYIFDPDPLTRDGVSYGGGYVDNGDANTPELAGARSMVTLPDITFDGSMYILEGPYAAIREFESPNRGTFEQTSNEWHYEREAAEFEGAMTYWHLDNYMRYINETLGIEVMPSAYSTGVQFDAHGLNGVDNSHYIPSADRLAFGEGCVDDNEDADVIVHELGHGLHDWLTNGGLSQVNGLSEGLGDYFAASYTRSLGLLSPEDDSYNWVYKWDGHNECWGGRITDDARDYPDDLVGQIHFDGQMWASTLMNIWNDIGGEKIDAAVIEGIAMTNSSTSQEEAAQAVLQAAANMNYSEADIQAMMGRFEARGYTITPVDVNVERGPKESRSGGYELTRAAPNPFNGKTVFELVLDRRQPVVVDAIDTLGRQVATLHEGTLRAGVRHPFTLQSAGLQSGVYVIRVRGEDFVATRTVTLAQ